MKKRVEILTQEVSYYKTCCRAGTKIETHKGQLERTRMTKRLRPLSPNVILQMSLLH